MCPCLVVLFVVFMPLTQCAHILGICPMPAPSHKIVLTSLFEELALRGHHLTVISPFSLKNAPPNYREIVTDLTLSDVLDNNYSNLTLFDIEDLPPIKLVLFLFGMGFKLSELTLKSPAVQKFITDPQQKFDLVILEYFFDEALLGFAHIFNTPVIGVSPFSGTEHIADSVGDPYPYSYIPYIYSDFTVHMTFIQRLQNTLINSFLKIARPLYYIPKQDEIMRKYFRKESLPSTKDLERNTSLILLNDHFSYSISRPHVPNVIEVGGMHIKPSQKLPQSLQSFLDNSINGVIYFSFGSNMKSSDMSLVKKKAFLDAFSRIKENIIWKFEDDSLTDLPANVRLDKWLPQSDLLGHPNVRVFITHGGLLSVQEAIYNGVPLIGIPMFADQKLNIMRAVADGYAVLLDYKNATGESIYWALQEISKNPKYRNIMKQTSRVYRDQPETPMERAVYWTEYVIRHKGAAHMRSAGLDLKWYQYYLLDVILVLLSAIILTVSVPLLIVTKIFKRIFGSSKRKQIKSVKKTN